MLNPFKKPTVDQLVEQQIEDTQRALLDALNGKEFAESMVQYHTTKLNRLMAQRPAVQAPVPSPLSIVLLDEPEHA